jgi:hypothetical protein
MSTRAPHNSALRLSGSALALALALAPVACTGGESKPSLAEAMKKADEKPPATPKSDKEKKPLPSADLPPPSEAEIKAWDRKDPEGERHLYKWDKRNLAKMFNYFKELRCFKEKMREEGQKAFGAEPQSPEDEKWYQFKRVFIPFMDLWQQRLFANEPRILEKSKFIGHFLEAHELVMNGYPSAFNHSDEIEVQKQDAHWLLVEDKVKRYVDQLGGSKKHKLPDPESEKDMKKWAKFCEKALNPKPSKGEKKIRGKKTPI